MKLFIQFFSILLILAGLSFLFDPEIITGFLEVNSQALWLYISAIVARLVLGAVLIKSANMTRYPVAIKIFGYLVVLAAIIFIFIGRENFQDFMSAIIPFIKPYGRLAGILVMVFGGLLFYAYSDKKKNN